LLARWLGAWVLALSDLTSYHDQSDRDRIMLEEKTLTATEFKAKCLELMDDIVANRLSAVTITKRGKVVARMVAPPMGALRPIHDILGKPRQLLADYDPFAQLIELPENWPQSPLESAKDAAA
jgi:antitoxin (DNA-binding transcriptional repressor) of toxin-antitoxin stability system